MTTRIATKEEFNAAERELSGGNISGKLWSQNGIALVIGNGPTALEFFYRLPDVMSRIRSMSYLFGDTQLVRVFVCNDISGFHITSSDISGFHITSSDIHKHATLVAVSSRFSDYKYAKRMLGKGVADHVIISRENYTNFKRIMLESIILDAPGFTHVAWHSIVDVEENPISFNAHEPFCKFGMSHLVTFQFLAANGFRTVLLAGFDMDYKPIAPTGIDPNHYYNKYWNDDNMGDMLTQEYADTLTRDQMLAHSLAYAGMSKAGIKVYNTTGGPLSAFYEDLVIL